MIRIASKRWRLPLSTAVTVAGLALAAAAIPSVAAASTTAAHPGHVGHGNRFAQVNLVSDTPGAATITDPNLVNPWGLSQGPTSPVWVSDNGKDVSTLYTEAPGQTPAAVPLVVTIPGGAPTGQAFNPTKSFVLSDGQPAAFIFAGEDGDISAWNGQLTDRTTAVHVASVPGGDLKGLALVQPSRGGPEILVADFRHGIVAFDASFQPVTLPRGAFTDRRVPRGY